jgi:hypothetical protein
MDQCLTIGDMLLFDLDDGDDVAALSMRSRYHVSRGQPRVDRTLVKEDRRYQPDLCNIQR